MAQNSPTPPKKFHDPSPTYKLWIHYHNGKKITHFSHEIKDGKRFPEMGLRKLEELVATKRGQYFTALIFEIATDTKVREYKQGVRTL